MKLLISTVLLVCQMTVTVKSTLIINELKLWGNESSQYVELYNDDANKTVSLWAEYSLLLVDDPVINTGQPLKVYSVIDIPENTTIDALKYLSIPTPNISDIIYSNITVGVVLHKKEDDEVFKKDDNVTESDITTSVVFTHDETKRITFLSSKLNVIDNHVDLAVGENQSLSACGFHDLGVLELTTPSPGESNSEACGSPPVTTTASPPTTTAGTVTSNTSPGSPESSSTSSAASGQTTVNVTDTTQPTPTNSSTPPPSVTSTAVTSIATSPSSPVTPGSTIPTTTVHNPIEPTNLTINEVNIMMGDTKHVKFIEIHGPRMAHYENTSLKLIDGMHNTDLEEHEITHTDEKGLFFIELTKEYTNISCLAIVILYNEAVIDGFIISVEGSVMKEVQEKYTPSKLKDLFIFDPSRVRIPADMAMSISKCGYILDEPGDYMVTIASPGKKNNCTTSFHQKIQLKLIDADCQVFKDNIELKREVASEIVRITGKTCRCGLSTYVLQEKTIHCGSVIFEAYVRTVTQQQVDDYTDIYKEFIKSTKSLMINNKSYKVNTSCYEHCYVHTQPTPKDDSNNDINVTVAVVVSCVVVFILIVLVVIVYLKKKRNGILQFSMVRLEEDNGLLMDDTKGVRFREGSAIII